MEAEHLLRIMAVLLGPIAVASMAFVTWWKRSRAEWSCSWQGHMVRVVATQNRKELWIDGQRFAEKITLIGFEATLTHTLHAEGQSPVVFSAVVSFPNGREGPVARIYADGLWIGGTLREEPVPDLVASHPAPGTAAALPTTSSEPTDPRWRAATVLIDDLRASDDARVREAGERCESPPMVRLTPDNHPNQLQWRHGRCAGRPSGALCAGHPSGLHRTALWARAAGSDVAH